MKYTKNPLHWPLKYWSENQNQFTELSKIAFKMMSLPDSSVQSERYFSTAGIIYNKLSSSMSGDTFEKIYKIDFYIIICLIFEICF